VIKNLMRVTMLTLPLLVCEPALAATFTVTNTNDSGAGSLRQAMTDAVAATATADHDTIVGFNIPGAGVHTIRPNSPLPAIKDLLIDGFTQPGSSENTLDKGSNAVLTIEIDGSNAGVGAHGLVNEGTVPGQGIPTITVRGLVINRFSGAGIHVTGPGGAGFPGFLIVRACYIGTDPTGTQARGNGIGIELGTDAQAIIGEVTPDFGGGNSTPWPGNRMLISGNVGAGITFNSSDPNEPAFGTVRGAYIGTDASGLVALGNGGDGITISPESALGSLGKGGTVWLYDNVIAANGGDGIDTQGLSTMAAFNWIGMGLDGGALGNQGNGAYFHGIGGGALSARFPNLGTPGPGVANNAGAGVLIADTALVDVSGPLFANLGLGLDIAPVGPNANDATDSDAGPNESLNYPVITSAVSSPSTASTRIQGTINTRPNSSVEVHLYMNPSCHASGYGESSRYVGSVIGLTTAADGSATFDKTLPFAIDTTMFPVVVAQARRFAETPIIIPSALEVSEFSACFALTGAAPLPTLSIDDVSLNEGNAGTSTATFTVTLSAAAAASVTVNYATANGTATAGTDYVSTNGTLTFATGEVTKTVAVTINGDTSVEANETVAVNLSAVSGATLAKAQGLATLVNDDVAPPPPLPTLSIDDPVITEGNAGTVSASFTVTLSAAAAGAVTVNYATANGTATAGSDYVAGSGTLTFAAGETTKAFAITVNGDTAVEANETFTVSLSTASGATIAKASGQATITNDDSAPPPGGGGGGGGAIDAWLLAALALTTLISRARGARG
jgi:hypothetical protein